MDRRLRAEQEEDFAEGLAADQAKAAAAAAAAVAAATDADMEEEGHRDDRGGGGEVVAEAMDVVSSEGGGGDSVGYILSKLHVQNTCVMLQFIYYLNITTTTKLPYWMHRKE